MSKLIVALLGLTAVPAFANFDHISCRTTEADGTAWESTVDAGDDSATNALLMNGTEIPAIRACMTWAHGNVHVGGKWRCPHGEAGSDTRYEVYPIMSPPQGLPRYIRLVIWKGDTVRGVDLKDCGN